MMTILFIDTDSIALFIIPFLLIVLAGSLATSMVKSGKKRQESYESLDNEVDDADAIAVGACVVSKRTAKEYVGDAKNAKYRPIFFVEFRTDEGEIFEYEVTEDVFESVGVGQFSTLVTCEDKFIAFEEGEDIC